MSNPPVAFILFSSLRGAVLFSLFPLRAQSISLQADLLELLLPSLSQFSLNELKKCSFSLFHFLLLVHRRTNANEKLVPMKMKTGNFTMELHHTRTHTHTHTRVTHYWHSGDTLKPLRNQDKNLPLSSLLNYLSHLLLLKGQESR